MKTILITGAGSGLGRATARLFLEEGWRVGLVGRREDALAGTADGHEAALVLPCDVTDADAAEGAVARLASEWGRLDALFNNAGINVASAPIDEIPVEDIRQVFEINVLGMAIMARAAFGQMRRQDPQGGRIVNNGSISAHVPRPGSLPYTASKHAVTGMTRTLSLDGRPFGIACGQIDIGNARSDMAARMETGVPQADGSVRAEAMMEAADVARAVLHMASMPEGANVQFMTVMATTMPFIGRG